MASASATSAAHDFNSIGSGIIKFPVTLENISEWDIKGLDGESGLSCSPAFVLDVPFAPFPRSDRLGRIADWTGPSEHAASAIGSVGGGRKMKVSTRPEEENAGWTFTADRTLLAANKKSGSSSFKAYTAPLRVDGGSSIGANGNRSRGPGRRIGWGGQRFANDRSQRKREPSVLISSTWRILEEIEFSRLAKLQLDPEDPSVVATIGSVPIFDPLANKINTKNERPIPTSDIPTETFKPLIDDAKLLSLAKEVGATIIMSDATASALMASKRSVIPWDIIISKTSTGLLVIDQRSESNLGSVTVNENAPDTPNDELSASLMTEATRLGNFSLPSVLGNGFHKYSDGISDCAYRYTQLDLGDGNIAIVRSIIRLAMSSVQSDKNDSWEPVLIIPLLEVKGEKTSTASMDWKTKLDTQRGAVLAHEIRNNGAQMARGVFSALLSASEAIKLVYVHRSKSSFKVLGLQSYEPYELASQMSLDVPNGYGILRATIDLIKKQPGSTGEFLLMRDPNKPLLRLYKISSDVGPEGVESVIDDLIPATAHLQIDDAVESGNEDADI